MLFVVAAWACMVLVMSLSWLWLVHQRPHGAVAGDGENATRANHHTRLTRITLRSVAMLAALNAALLLLHFLLPAGEWAADHEWAAPHPHHAPHHARNATVSANATASNHTRVSERAPRRRGNI